MGQNGIEQLSEFVKLMKRLNKRVEAYEAAKQVYRDKYGREAMHVWITTKSTARYTIAINEIDALIKAHSAYSDFEQSFKRHVFDKFSDESIEYYQSKLNEAKKLLKQASKTKGATKSKEWL